MKTVCLVGCGRIGHLHAKNLSSLAALRFYSRTRASAEKFNAEFNGFGVYDSYEDVLEDHSVDALVISSPPEFHTTQIIRAMDAGKAVLVEKPMCLSEKEIGEIESAVERCPGVMLMVAENYYYKPFLERLKSAIRTGRIGQVQSVRIQKLTSQGDSGWKKNHGALLEGGIHFVAFLSDLLEGTPNVVEATFPHALPGNPERHSIIRLLYGDGVQAELQYAWDVKRIAKGLFQHSFIQGTQGRIVFESNGLYAFVLSKGLVTPLWPALRDLMGYGGMTRDFINCLQDPNQKPYSDFSKSYRDLHVIFEAYRNRVE